MKKSLASTATILVAMVSSTAPASAQPWFDRWDRNHDHHWSYAEFRRAHYDYWAHHRAERHWKEAELRAEFNRRAAAHREWVDAHDMQDFHHW